MTPKSLLMMRTILNHIPPGGTILDVGSLDVNGTFKPLVTDLGFDYLGVDIREGPNVDTVVNPYWFPYQEGSFAAVISGSTMEHVEKPWVWLPELARLVQPGGVLAVISHWMWELHEHPKDYWRFMPDGMRTLFEECKGLSEPRIDMEPLGHISGWAYKRHPGETI